MSADDIDMFEAGLHKALGHPLRLRILELVIENREASPLGPSRQLRQPLATVSRHMRVLRDLGFVELVRTEPRRGAVEHFYRAVQRAYIDSDTWEQLSVTLRNGLLRQTFRRIFSEASDSGAGADSTVRERIWTACRYALTRKDTPSSRRCSSASSSTRSRSRHVPTNASGCRAKAAGAVRNCMRPRRASSC